MEKQEELANKLKTEIILDIIKLKVLVFEIETKQTILLRQKEYSNEYEYGFSRDLKYLRNIIADYNNSTNQLMLFCYGNQF
jgi:hypothetical protein